MPLVVAVHKGGEECDDLRQEAARLMVEEGHGVDEVLEALRAGLIEPSLLLLTTLLCREGRHVRNLREKRKKPKSVMSVPTSTASCSVSGPHLCSHVVKDGEEDRVKHSDPE